MEDSPTPSAGPLTEAQRTIRTLLTLLALAAGSMLGTLAAFNALHGIFPWPTYIFSGPVLLLVLLTGWGSAAYFATVIVGTAVLYGLYAWVLGSLQFRRGPVLAAVVLHAIGMIAAAMVLG